MGVPLPAPVPILTLLPGDQQGSPNARDKALALRNRMSDLMLTVEDVADSCIGEAEGDFGKNYTHFVRIVLRHLYLSECCAADIAHTDRSVCGSGSRSSNYCHRARQPPHAPMVSSGNVDSLLPSEGLHLHLHTLLLRASPQAKQKDCHTCRHHTHPPRAP